ncbi:MAG: HEAT repeat domain-containing protein [Acidobacteriia bacterium]|nr:HEAT repeat domain-containing protein [Terriglobia bacterium]
MSEHLHNPEDVDNALNRAMIVRCEDIEALAILYACDDLDAAARAALEQHVKQCAACAAVFSREARLYQAIASFDQPADSLDRAGLLLAECRSQLAEAIDDHEAKRNQPGWRPVFSPAAWWSVVRDTLIYHPAMSMAALVIVSFLAGVAGQRTQVASTPVAPRPVMTVSAVPKITDQQLHSAQSASVGWVTPSDSRTPTVQVQLMSPTPTSIEGAPEDADVERALTFVLENSRQFDPGARMDSLNVLRTLAGDPEVRRSLCGAARSDTNPGVRMRALESLQGFEQDPAVRQTILDALQNDANSGVRVSAINLLLNSLETGNEPGSADPQTLAVLRDRLRNDSNNYIRLQSAAALRDLGAGK